MKSRLLLLLLFISTFSFSQDHKKYMDAMQRNLKLMDTAQSVATLQQLSNSFERIGNAEKDIWLPYYYASYCLARLSFATEDKSQLDGMLDKAQQLIDKADTLQPENSEIYTVKSMITSGRIMVDPSSRGAQFGPQSGMILEKAIQLDPENPRPYLLKGTAAFYTPAAYGGGKDKATALLQKSLLKYDKFQPSDELMPDWGEARAKQLLEMCKQ